MAPPRKYEVDMSGEVIGIDHGPKTPVLTKEEVKDEEVKEERKSGIYRGKESRKRRIESSETDEPIIVPTVPGDSSRRYSRLVQKCRNPKSKNLRLSR